MTLEDVILGRLRLSLSCSQPACAEETSIDATFFAARHGLNMTLDDLKAHLVCTGCGSRSFTLITTPLRDHRVGIKRVEIKQC